jgi:hypothetical protein
MNRARQSFLVLFAAAAMPAATWAQGDRCDKIEIKRTNRAESICCRFGRRGSGHRTTPAAGSGAAGPDGIFSRSQYMQIGDQCRGGQA